MRRDRGREIRRNRGREGERGRWREMLVRKIQVLGIH